MRSPTNPAHPSARPAPEALLESLARIVDDGAVGSRDHLLVFAADVDADELELGVRPLERGTHPFTAMAGLVAPPEWQAFGVRAVGTARRLDEPDRPPERTATTMLVDRAGHQVSLLRSADGVERVPGPLEGTIPDACRRVLGLPTAPAPPSSAVLWTLIWLDRALAAWSEPATRRAVTRSWPSLARLHPAAAPGVGGLDDPDELVRAARAHADAWPWARLRREPEAAPLPGSSLPADVTGWMDDGFYARWATGAFPSIRTLATELPALLGEPLGPILVRTATALVG